ncbi:MAG TPA: 3-hydroxyacyl-ACP dehydratase FabZ [Nitrospirae bacterium]|nr:3-hydroxyacyl-ACP dehydratase FabZ [Nitrospirota bacterium]
MIDIIEIQNVIPHRYPFLLIDKIIELNENDSAVGIKNVTINEPFFQGHFPGNPIMPGVLIVEAMAQVSAFLAYKSGAKGKGIFFMSIEKVKFRKPVVPGDQLRISVKTTHRRNTVWKISGQVFVNDKLVTEAEFTAMIADKIA